MPTLLSVKELDIKFKKITTELETLENQLLKNPGSVIWKNIHRRFEEFHKVRDIIENIRIKLEIEDLYLHAIEYSENSMNNTYIHLSAEYQVYLGKLEKIRETTIKEGEKLKMFIQSTTTI